MNVWTLFWKFVFFREDKSAPFVATVATIADSVIYNVRADVTMFRLTVEVIVARRGTWLVTAVSTVTDVVVDLSENIKTTPYGIRVCYLFKLDRL